MSEQQARHLKPGQIVIYDGDPKDTGTVLGILRSGVSVRWNDEIPTTGITLWKDVEHLTVWESSSLMKLAK